MRLTGVQVQTAVDGQSMCKGPEVEEGLNFNVLLKEALFIFKSGSQNRDEVGKGESYITSCHSPVLIVRLFHMIVVGIVYTQDYSL